MKEEIKNNIIQDHRKRLIEYDKELFTFLDYDNVPWNNNNVERAIKNFADYRRNLEGKITENGLRSHLILLSIYQTCNYKGINFLKFLLSK